LYEQISTAKSYQEHLTPSIWVVIMFSPKDFISLSHRSVRYFSSSVLIVRIIIIMVCNRAVIIY